MAAAGCATAADPSAGFDREVRGGRFHAAPITDFHRPDQLDLAAALATPELRLATGGIEAAELRERGRTISLDGSGVALVHVALQQQVLGVPIHGAYLSITARPAATGAPARLAASAYHLFPGAHAEVVPALDADDAQALARVAARAPATAQIRTSELVLWPIEGRLYLVWEITIAGSERRVLVHAGAERVGEFEVIDDRIDAASGVVTGWIAEGGAPGGAGKAMSVPLPDLAVTVGSATVYTSSKGAFALSGSGTVTAALAGTATTIIDAGGAPISASVPAGAGLAIALGASTSEHALAQVTAFHAITAMRTFLLANGFAPTELGAPVVAKVNVADTCNAYFSPADRTLTFFRAGGGCRNSAERSIAAHEYGHFVDDAYGGIADGGLSEGWGDVLACLSSGDPIVGPDLLPGQIIRTCANDYVYPASGSDEVHALGQAWAGFVWDARAGLRDALGAQKGDALIRALVLPSLRTNATDIPAAVREVFLRDDDDGDLGNHTPHWDALMAAAQRHGLDTIMGGDLTAPAPISDLHATEAHAASVTVAWTAPGDDGATGTAAAYELRWSTSPIDAASFPAATAVATAPPAKAGSPQTLTIALPPAVGTIWIAVRARDEVGNVGALSNIVEIASAPSTTVLGEGAESGATGWATTGLWHVSTRRAAAGTHAFWYGSEATGTYDTGAITAGTLTSPPIDLTAVTHPTLGWREWLQVEGAAGYDRATVTVTAVDDPALTVTTSRDRSTTLGVFLDRGLDLAAFAGHKVTIRFAFDSVDNAANAYEGWFVDEIRILSDAAPPPAGAGLVIDEILADPPAGYDANGDGKSSTRDDEFVELVNAGATALDLSGYTLADSTRTRLTFPTGTSLAPGKALVVFGGGKPASTGALALVAPGGLVLNNGGDAVRVHRPDGEVVAEVSYGAEGGRDQSLVRKTEGDGAAPFVLHRTVSAAPASPGRRSDGSGW
ncbi:MAG: lamin tail domain-containing protein [Deltaproteobacteria bacterium]|nr:lamin tail domain-containing protein [Deltaproteobacteria bacterium]